MAHLIDVPGLRFPIVAFTLVVLLVTSLRVYLRVVKKRFWWDDFFAVVGAIYMCLQTVMLWFMLDQMPIYMERQSIRVAVYYINSTALYVEGWAARLAILYTIIRIQNSLPIRRALHAVGLGFIVLFIVNNILLIVQCEEREKLNAWHHIIPALCHVPDDIPVFQIVSSFLSDGIIVIVPIYTLQALVLHRHLRKRLIGIFSASLLITIAWTVQSIWLIVGNHLGSMIVGLVAGYVALIICNLTVVIPRILQWFGVKEGLGSHPSPQSVSGVTLMGIWPQSPILSAPSPITRVAPNRMPPEPSPQASVHETVVGVGAETNQSSEKLDFELDDLTEFPFPSITSSIEAGLPMSVEAGSISSSRAIASRSSLGTLRGGVDETPTVIPRNAL